MGTLQLDVWEGGWGLPSIDTGCLQIMTYAKFSGIPVKLLKTNNPWRSPTGFLPVLRNGKQVICTKFEEAVAHFRKHNFNADFDLNNKQLSDVKAYTSILEEKLQPALLYVWWIDSKNYVELTRPWYAKALPFPQNYFVPGRYQKDATERLAALHCVKEVEDVQVETKVYREAQECINMLSNRLGDDDYFFGRSPTSLDATVFAYLAPLLKVTFPNPALQNHLKSSDNLMRFIFRILHRYFPLSVEEIEDLKKKEETEKQKHSDVEFPNRRRNQIFCTLFALMAMLGYAFTAGMVQVEVVDAEKSGSDDSPELPEFLEDGNNDDS